ncbi:MAG: hypothetical protein QF662_01355 [Phycisphaerae bacterium]|jgi:hypothetical protein|nr:hypothetical protein [Phycisphaerae bacterium]
MPGSALQQSFQTARTVHLVVYAEHDAKGGARRAGGYLLDAFSRVLRRIGYEVAGEMHDASRPTRGGSERPADGFMIRVKVKYHETGHVEMIYRDNAPAGPKFTPEAATIEGKIGFFSGDPAANGLPPKRYVVDFGAEHEFVADQDKLIKEMVWSTPAAAFIERCGEILGIERIRPLTESQDAALKKSAIAAEQRLRVRMGQAGFGEIPQGSSTVEFRW